MRCSWVVCTQLCHHWDFRARNVQFQVLVYIYFVQRLDFIWGSHNGRVETFGNRDREAAGSNPACFTHLHRNFIIASGTSERSFCIFQRIHVLLTLASQVAYDRLWAHFFHCCASEALRIAILLKKKLPLSCIRPSISAAKFRLSRILQQPARFKRNLLNINCSTTLHCGGFD